MTSKPTVMRGLFVSFEGGEGAGKSTQIAHLARRLRERGWRVVATREPGGSQRAERIRSILLSGKAKDLGSPGETMLFAAARRDHVETLIAPALGEGAVVLCDRFIDSTRVYQGVVAGLDRQFLGALEAAATEGTVPDLTLVIDVPAELGLERAGARRAARGEAADRFEAEDLAYHEKVRDAFLAIARAEPQRCVLVDGSATEEKVAEAVWAALEPRLAERAGQGASS